jgi:outer membrane protein
VTTSARILAVAFAAVSVLAAPGLAQAGDFNFDDLEFQAGGIAFVSPRYEGSKSYQVQGVPFVFPGSKGGDDDFEFSDADSIQYRLIKSGMFEAGPLAGAWFGRSENDGSKLGGLGKISEGLVVGGFAAINTGMTKFTSSFHHQVTGDDVGSLIRVRADSEVPITNGIKFLAGVGTNYATEGYMDTNFGVTAAQAVSSAAAGVGLPVYNSSAGFKDIFVGAGFEAELDSRWTARVYGEYSRLIGDAGNSPVIETQDQFSGLLILMYQFGHSGDASAPAAPLK